MTTTGDAAGAGVADDAGRRDALADRLFTSMIESMELASVYLGLRLEQQAVAGLLDVEEGTAAGGGQDWETRRYRLPAAHAEVLLDPDNPSHAGATAYWMGSLATVREWADQAGFASLQVLPVDHLFWRFYQMSG